MWIYSLERISRTAIFFPIIDGAPSILHSITLFKYMLFSVKNLSIPMKKSQPLAVITSEMQASSSSVIELSFKNLPKISWACAVISVHSSTARAVHGEFFKSSKICSFRSAAIVLMRLAMVLLLRAESLTASCTFLANGSLSNTVS